jgi:hypothetical protein
MSTFSKRLLILTGNKLKIAMKLIKFVWSCSICVPSVTLHTSTPSSNSSHARRNCDSTTLATLCEIHWRSSWKDWGVGGLYTRFLPHPHRQKSRGVRSGNLGGQELSPPPSILAFSTWDAISFASDRSATSGWNVTIIFANENLVSFFAVFKSFHVYISNIFETNLPSNKSFMRAL